MSTGQENSSPWWIAGDRERLGQMRSVIKGKPETALVRYCGDMRPMLVSEVRKRMNDLTLRIAADIARFQRAKGDYAEYNRSLDCERAQEAADDADHAALQRAERSPYGETER